MSTIDGGPDDERPKRRRGSAKPAAVRKRTMRGPERQERRFAGLGICSGIAVGRVAFAAEAPASVTARKLEVAEVEPELRRLDEAVQRSLHQLQKLKARLAFLSEDSQAEIAPLLDAYRQMLGPSRLLRHAARRIADDHLNAEAAVSEEAEALARRLAAKGLGSAGPDAEDAASASRQAEEVREIGRRLVRNLARAPFRSFATLPVGCVLVTEQLRPADAALIDPSRIAAVVTDEGGTADHTAIMLRALGIPSVLGVAGFTAHAAARVGVHAGAYAAVAGQAAAQAPVQVVVDGDAGLVVLDPSPPTLEAAHRAVIAHAGERQRLGRLRRLPARLSGGEAVELQANLELPAELPLIAQAGAAGIGLLRTEFLFINADELPDEAVQAEAYRGVVEAMGGDCVTIRLLDWGSEKQSEAMAGFLAPGDLNPALGLRGLRLLLRHPSVMETQLAAILRISGEAPVRIMLPMVTTLAELRAAREIYERVGRRMRRRGVRLPEKLPPLGVMIETPAAALSAEILALEAEFLAIGTNDLAMYTLATDRASTDVSALYDPLHPAVLRLIGQTTDAALRLRRPVSLCGEIAGSPLVVPLLMGMGLRSFSMNASAIPRVKQVVRQASLDECRRLARRVLEESDPGTIAQLLTAFAAR